MNDYVLIKGNNFYVFNKPISKRDQKKSRGKKTKSKFWRKIKRLKRKNKIHYFKISFKDKWIDSTNKEYENDYTVSDVFDGEFKIAESINKKICSKNSNLPQKRNG